MCIASPNAAGAQGDAAEAAFRRKLRRYRREIPELAAAGIAYRPLVWTADGRPHPAVTRTLRLAAGQAASKGGGQSTPKALMERWKHEIQIAIMRRRAAMMRAVVPGASAAGAWLLTGRSDAAPSSTGRMQTIEEEQEAEDEDFAEREEADGEDPQSGAPDVRRHLVLAT